MKKILFSALFALAVAPVWADGENNDPEDFASDEHLEAGFITEHLNKAIEKAMPELNKMQNAECRMQNDSQTDNTAQPNSAFCIQHSELDEAQPNSEFCILNSALNEDVKYGRTVTDYVTAPKFGGYFIGKYEYSSQDGKNSGGGFSQRLVRAYVDGKILNDFTYRVQVQLTNASFHMKDFFIEWGKYKEFKVKIGQYKRAFGFENPMNPWDVGDGDYSQLTKKLTGHSDYIGSESSSNGGRDQGIQVQGDLFPMKDGHRLIHYQLMLANGQGINTADANARKDVIGTLQLQPIKGLTFGFFGWTGNATYNGITVDRNRYMVSAKYDNAGWTARAEYAHSTGHKISDYYTAADVANSMTLEKVAGALKPNASNGRADAWYATVGIPMTPWLKTYIKYDVYRDDATSATAKSIYSICPNIQLHKNLMFQLQYNYVNDKTLAKSNYSQLWLETYVRF